MNAQIIIATESFANATEYVNVVKGFAPELAWDTVKDWRTLCHVIGVNYELEAKGKARPAIEKVAKRLASTSVIPAPEKKAPKAVVVPAPVPAKKVSKPVAKPIETKTAMVAELPEVKEVSTLPELKNPKTYGTPDAWAVVMGLATGQGWTKMARNLGLVCNDGEGQRAIYKAYVQQKQDGNGENVRVVVEKPAPVVAPLAAEVKTPTEPMPKRMDFKDEDEFDAAYDVWYRAHRMPKEESKAEVVEPVVIAEPIVSVAPVVKEVVTEIKAEKPAKEVKVTALEIQVLDNIVTSEYQDTWDVDGELVWSFSVTNEDKKLAGALGSLVKKGLATCFKHDGEDEVCGITKKGLEVLESQAGTKWAAALEKRAKDDAGIVEETVTEEVAKPVVATVTPAPASVVVSNETDIDETARLIAQALAGLKNPAKPVDAAQIADMVAKNLADFEERLDDKYASSLTNNLPKIVKEIKDETLNRVQDMMNGLSKKIDEVGQTAGSTVEVKVNGVVTGKVEGVQHERFADILRHVSVRDNVLLVGPAGSGKTTACEQVATALGLQFFCKSVCAQTSKSELLGYMDANGRFVTTEFRLAYEQGGVFILDEIDAGNPNVVAVLNSALANGYCAFADQMVKKHEDFVLIACANTYGTGADRQYVGRNQLDAATLDRFSMIEFGYDLKLEKEIAPDSVWCEFIQTVRAELKNERVVVSPRATIQGGRLLATGASPRYIMEVRVLKGMDQALRMRVESIYKRYYKG